MARLPSLKVCFNIGSKESIQTEATHRTLLVFLAFINLAREKHSSLLLRSVDFTLESLSRRAHDPALYNFYGRNLQMLCNKPAFDPGKPSKTSLMFVGTARSLPLSVIP